MIKVLIADDQELIRQSLEIVLSGREDITVIGMAANGREVLDKIKRERPDVILMDVRMPRMDGVSCTKAIKQDYPEIKIIILTTFDDDEYVFSALRHGASGYLLKGVSMDTLHESIKIVHEGGSLMNPDVASKVFREFSKMSRQEIEIQVENQAIREIQPNEWKIIREISRGSSNKEIAHKLAFSEGTVRNYLSSVLNKTGLRDRTQLAIWAVQAGLAELEDKA